jgi:hypothetical protein
MQIIRQRQVRDEGQHPDMCANLRYRKRQLGAIPVIGFFLNRPFWCQKHHFKLKKRDYF